MFTPYDVPHETYTTIHSVPTCIRQDLPWSSTTSVWLKNQTASEYVRVRRKSERIHSFKTNNTIVDVTPSIILLLTPSSLSYYCWRHPVYHTIVDVIQSIILLLTSPRLSYYCWRHPVYHTIVDAIPSIILLLTSSRLSYYCWRHRVITLLYDRN